MSVRRPKEDQNLWNFIFSILFLVVLVAAASTMEQVRGGFLASVTPLDLVILAFAAFRLTRLIVYDKIARWFRELFVASREVTQDGVPYIELTPLNRGFRHTVHDLLGCPWCIGIWSSLLVIFVYAVFPWGWFFDLFLAVASMGSLLQVTANLIGWGAENGKLRAHAAQERH